MLINTNLHVLSLSFINYQTAATNRKSFHIKIICSDWEARLTPGKPCLIRTNEIFLSFEGLRVFKQLIAIFLAIFHLVFPNRRNIGSSVFFPSFYFFLSVFSLDFKVLRGFISHFISSCVTLVVSSNNINNNFSAYVFSRIFLNLHYIFPLFFISLYLLYVEGA